MKESKAPDITKLSKTLLLQSFRLTLLTKSKMEIKLPDSFLTFIIFLTGPCPIPLQHQAQILFHPLSFTANLYQLSLTSGPNTLSPILLHSFMKNVTDLISFMLLLKTEAMYSAG